MGDVSIFSTLQYIHPLLNQGTAERKRFQFTDKQQIKARIMVSFPKILIRSKMSSANRMCLMQIGDLLKKPLIVP